MVNPRENEDELTMLRNTIAVMFGEEEDILEDMKADDEEFLHPMQKYEIRFSTSKPKKKFLLTARTNLRFEMMTHRDVKDILQDWINENFEEPFKVKEIFSIENL